MKSQTHLYIRDALVPRYGWRTGCGKPVGPRTSGSNGDRIDCKKCLVAKKKLDADWEKVKQIREAAPRLLEACHDALNNLPPDSECAALVRSAVAAAEGGRR